MGLRRSRWRAGGLALGRVMVMSVGSRRFAGPLGISRLGQGYRTLGREEGESGMCP